VWLLAVYGQPTGRLTARVVWGGGWGLRVDGRLAPFHIHHMNWVNSRGGFCYSDITINIIILIIIIIILSLPALNSLAYERAISRYVNFRINTHTHTHTHIHLHTTI